MMRVLNFGLVGIMALCIFAATSAVLAQDTLQIATSADERQFLGDAESLLAAGQSSAAYTLLVAREADLAGNPYFDYLLGVAALDSGRHGEAIFSLRRSLSIAPDYSGARMELARAYFDSGNARLARPLFVRLLDESPPLQVRRIINDYIASIDARPSTPAASFRYSFDVAAGHDDNANGSTNNDQFLGFTLSPENLQTESLLFEAGANFNWNKPNSTQSAWFAGGRASYRHNPDASFVDSGVISGKLGLSWQRGAFFGRAGVDAYWATRDGDPNQNYFGLDAVLGSHVADNWDLTFNLRGGAIRHDNAIETLDVDRILYSGGLTYRFTARGNIGIEIIGGEDSEANPGSLYGHSKSGGRLTLYMPIGRSGQLFASAGSLSSDYDGLFFGGWRKDTQASSILQITFRDVWVDGLSLTPRLRHIDNDSNLALYDYDRTEVTLQLRWMPQ